MRLLPIAILITAFLAGCVEASEPVEEREETVAEVPGVHVFGAGNASQTAIQAVARFLPTGHTGPEPNMGITSTGSVFVSAYSDIIRSQDGGETWDVVQTHQLMNSDPMMWVDPWTDCIYNAPMFPILLGATLYESCNDGDTWAPIHSQNMGRGVYDHQKLASALPGPDAPSIVGVVHPTSLIICYNALVATQCAVSFDGGRTWPHDVPIWTTAQGPSCAGQQSHPTGAPDGTIVVAKAWGCAQPLIFVTTDNGITWEMRDGPQGVGADTLDPEIAFTDDGTMYMLWQSQRDQSRAHLARSHDMGRTWAGPWDVTPPGMNSTIFAALGAGSPGRVAMAFHATSAQGDPGAVPDDARWNTYFVVSEDADGDEPTFVAHRMNDEDDPIQVGSICKGNRGCENGNRNLLDFIDGAVAPDGTFYAVIADGCVGECAKDPDATPADSRSRAAVVLRLDGWSLYS